MPPMGRRDYDAWDAATSVGMTVPQTAVVATVEQPLSLEAGGVLSTAQLSTRPRTLSPARDNAILVTHGRP